MESVQASVNNVLIADDDDEDYKFLSSAILDIKLTVILSRAENGGVLMRILNETVPDILFLDVLLPIKDGTECLKEIRADRRFDSLPIIMYTSLKSFETIEFCYREGSNLFICKPNTYSELLNVLGKIFSIDWKKMMYYPPFSQFVVNHI
jgi:DNA-binding response OmpR family regulator